MIQYPNKNIAFGQFIKCMLVPTVSGCMHGEFINLTTKKCTIVVHGFVLNFQILVGYLKWILETSCPRNFNHSSHTEFVWAFQNGTLQLMHSQAVF